MPSIGLLNEKPLHAALKQWVAQPGDRFEVSVDGYVIDIVRNDVRGDLLLEIQTGGFGALKRKLINLTRTHTVRLIYPIAQETWIVKLPADDRDAGTRRKSPKRGRVEDLFRGLVSFPHLLAEENFAIEVLLTREEELRRYVGGRSWRKRGWRTEERRLLDVVDRCLFTSPDDCLELLPPAVGSSFTTKDLAETLAIRRQLAQKMAYCLREMGAIEVVGKQARSVLYRVVR